jgi:hypothetical protein
VIQISFSGTSAIKSCPGWTFWPTCAARRPMIPSTGATIFV